MANLETLEFPDGTVPERNNNAQPEAGHTRPATLLAWRALDRLGEFWRPWEHLRQFFLDNGYDLFEHDRAYSGASLTPRKDLSRNPAEDSFGLFGTRSALFMSQFSSETAATYAARDTHNRDVVIKLIAKGNSIELEISRFINSELLRDRPENTTIKVLDFLTYEGWHFIVMPLCDDSQTPVPRNASECLEFAEQLTSVLAFLHQHLIAHLDVTFENVLINHYGLELTHIDKCCSTDPEYRLKFDVQYYLIDFNVSTMFSPDSAPESRLVQPFYTSRMQQAPEMRGSAPYDPFPADVYMTSRLLYNWLQNMLSDLPGALKTLRNMSYVHPKHRISMGATRAQFRKLRSTLNTRALLRYRSPDITTYFEVPYTKEQEFWNVLDSWLIKEYEKQERSDERKKGNDSSHGECASGEY